MSMKCIVVPIVVLSAFVAQSPAPVVDPDTDGDGLSDFQEQHKYLTDPQKPDSDGDGILDGDWLERREYQYTVRSVVQVMKPVTPEYLNDDYQDARVLDETDTWLELEVIHYPFNTVAETINGNPKWRNEDARLKRWTQPGPTADWTPEFRDELTRALRADAIDVTRISDLETVERVSQWLLQRATYHDGFSTFITAFDESGKPYLPEPLRDAAENGESEKGLSLQEQWAREISARGMFENRARGSCTSSAIYLNGCLRAVGIPTRIVLCIPVIDSSDERELALVRTGISHYGVRKTILKAVTANPDNWTSHTFNEVYVGGRWRRLNYEKLGQNILDPRTLGLMTHVATFSDWADARMPETIGRRQALGLRDDVFGGSNPYSTIALRDEFGLHCTLENPAPTPETLSIEQVFWTDSKQLPEDILAGLERRNRFGLVARLTNVAGATELRSFLNNTDLRVFLEAKGQATLGVVFDAGCWWLKNDMAWIYLPFGRADRRDLVDGVAYQFRPRNEKNDWAWVVPDNMKVIRY